MAESRRFTHHICHGLFLPQKPSFSGGLHCRNYNNICLLDAGRFLDYCACQDAIASSKARCPEGPFSKVNFAIWPLARTIGTSNHSRDRRRSRLDASASPRVRPTRKEFSMTGTVIPFSDSPVAESSRRICNTLICSILPKGLSCGTANISFTVWEAGNVPSKFF